MREMQETQIQSLGQEDPLEKEIATHSSIFPSRIPWTEEPSGLKSMGSESTEHSHMQYRENNACVFIYTHIWVFDHLLKFTSSNWHLGFQFSTTGFIPVSVLSIFVTVLK